MKILDFSDKKLAICGDIHGEFKHFFMKVKRNLGKETDFKFNKSSFEQELDKELYDGDDEDMSNQSSAYLKMSWKPYKKDSLNNTVIIVAGDCGFGFCKTQYYKDIFQKFNKVLVANDTFILFVRGNHDDPLYFSTPQFECSNIMCVEDYTVVKTQNTTTLCVGGAISADRIWRKQEECRINKYSSTPKQIYWANEPFVYDENALKEIKENGLVVDSIITHTCHKYHDKHEESVWFSTDDKLKDDIAKEKEELLKLENFFEKKQIKWWAHGHFHESRKQIYDDIVFFSMGIEELLYDFHNHYLMIKDILNSKKQNTKNSFSYTEEPFYHLDEIGQEDGIEEQDAIPHEINEPQAIVELEDDELLF